jgi:hypothetical protein
MRLPLIDIIRRLGENGCGFGRLVSSIDAYLRDRNLMPLRTALRVLLAFALGLPVVECVLIGVRSLVVSMGDAAGGKMLTCLATGCLAFWGVSIVGLVIVLAIIGVVDSEGDRRRTGE